MSEIYVLSNLDVAGSVNLNKNELKNVALQNLAADPSTPATGQTYWNTTTDTLHVFDGSSWRSYVFTDTPLNQLTAPTGNLSLNNHRITGLSSPVSGTDAVNKNYVDNATAGLSWKNAVRAATTANVTLSTDLENGDIIDGVTLATGDRVLVRAQTAGAENGIYVVAATGAPTRAADADSGAELQQAAVFIMEGTTLGDTAWVNTVNGTITVGSTALTFVQFTGGASITAGSGLSMTGNQLDVNVDGTSIEINADTLRVVPNLYSKKFTGTITGDGTTTQFTISHSFNTKSVTVGIHGTLGTHLDRDVIVPYTTNLNSVVVTFGTAPPLGNNYAVTVMA